MYCIHIVYINYTLHITVCVMYIYLCVYIYTYVYHIFYIHVFIYIILIYWLFNTVSIIAVSLQLPVSDTPPQDLRYWIRVVPTFVGPGGYRGAHLPRFALLFECPWCTASLCPDDGDFGRVSDPRGCKLPWFTKFPPFRQGEKEEKKGETLYKKTLSCTLGPLSGNSTWLGHWTPFPFVEIGTECQVEIRWSKVFFPQHLLP